MKGGAYFVKCFLLLINYLVDFINFRLEFLFFSLFKEYKLLKLFYLCYPNYCLSRRWISVNWVRFTLSWRILKRGFYISNHTVIYRNCDISNFSNSREMPYVLMKYSLTLIILILCYIMFSFSYFLRHNFSRTLFLNHNRIIVLSIFKFDLNHLDLIFKRFILIFKCVEIIELISVSFLNCLYFKKICLNVWFKLYHLILVSLRIF